MKKLLALLFLLPAAAFALSPMEWFNSLVAGSEDRGFRDGTFVQARFDQPSGMAFDDAGGRLFVADTLNHRIRLVHLDEQNRVETLAGTGAPGKADGPLASATFDKPALLAWVPPNGLAVYDQGDRSLRFLDLKAGTVRNLAPGTDLGYVWDLAYRPADGSLYFSQPLDHRLRRMELATGKLSDVLSQDPQVPSPRALCVREGILYVADAALPTVYQLVPPAGGTTAVALTRAASGDHILGLAWSEGNLYALQSGEVPLARLLPSYQPVSLITPWGFFVDKDNSMMQPFLHPDGTGSTRMAASPREPRKLLFSHPQPGSQAVISVKDYDFADHWVARTGGNGDLGTLADFSYPERKPGKTFRILVAGESRVVSADTVVPGLREGAPGPSVSDLIERSLRVNTFPKQMEFLLNTDAALNGVDRHYEVLSQGRAGWAAAFWVSSEVPVLAGKYDTDLVLSFLTPQEWEGFIFYYLRPITADGVPASHDDPEYLLKPYQQKVPPGAAEDLFNRCLKKGWVKVQSPTQVTFEHIGELLSHGDPQVRKDLVELMGRPFRLLAEKLRNTRTRSGQRPHFVLCFVPGTDTGGTAQVGDYEGFWKEVCEKDHLDFLDLSEPFNALSTGFYPTSDTCCHGHYTAYGNELIARIMGHALIEKRWIPFDRPRGKE